MIIMLLVNGSTHYNCALKTVCQDSWDKEYSQPADAFVEKIENNRCACVNLKFTHVYPNC